MSSLYPPSRKLFSIHPIKKDSNQHNFNPLAPQFIPGQIHSPPVTNLDFYSTVQFHPAHHYYQPLSPVMNQIPLPFYNDYTQESQGNLIPFPLMPTPPFHFPTTTTSSQNFLTTGPLPVPNSMNLPGGSLFINPNLVTGNVYLSGGLTPPPSV